MQSPLIEIKGLKKYFRTCDGQLHAVDDLNFIIDRGETLGVVGESGCGKSTLGRLLIKLLEPTGGEIFYDGKNITKYPANKMKKLRTQMQIIFQDPYSSLNPRYTISRIITEPIVVNKLITDKTALEKRTYELMELVGLAPRLYNAYPHELDGGRLQRAGIARALSVNPKFIVCDEPVSALDVSVQAQILNLLMYLQKDMGLTYMFITHDLSVVKHISDEIAVLYLGQCVEKAPTKELFKNPLHPYTRALLSAILPPSLSVRKKKMELIKGEVTSPIDPKPGCRFAARCKFVKPECTAENIQLKEQGDKHFVACTLYKS